MLADFSACTIWAFTASCAAVHTGLPDMWTTWWTVVARSCDPAAALGLDLDAAKHITVVWVPLLL